MWFVFVIIEQSFCPSAHATCPGSSKLNTNIHHVHSYFDHLHFTYLENFRKVLLVKRVNRNKVDIFHHLTCSVVKMCLLQGHRLVSISLTKNYTFIVYF